MKVTTDGCVFGAWAAIQIQSSKVKIQHVLDAGAGTGLLSLMVAQKSAASVTAVEIDAATATEASENFYASPWAARLQVVMADILDVEFHHPFDAIICNPPFYETDLKGPDEKRNAAHHSAQLKMDHLVPVLFHHLGSEGTLYLLLPFRRKSELDQMFRAQGLFVHSAIDVVLSRNPTRWMVALKKYAPQQASFATLQVKDSGGYTTECKRLLEDYYLQL